jgi:hypothetical protein
MEKTIRDQNHKISMHMAKEEGNEEIELETQKLNQWAEGWQTGEGSIARRKQQEKSRC